MPKNLDVDITIIGFGLSGAMLLNELLKTGCRKRILIIEKASVFPQRHIAYWAKEPLLQLESAY